MKKLKLDPYKSWVYGYTLGELEDMYRSDLQVNRHRLERASQEQATKFEKWHSASEDIEGDLADLKYRMTLLKSKKDLKFRRKYPKYKEAAFKSLIELDESVKKLQRKILETSRLLSKLKGAVTSAQQRKSMIQTLKDLYVANYWDKVTQGGTPVKQRRKTKKKRGLYD